MEKETAMKILKELHDKSLYSERTALETIIPELKESEDERIRKELIFYLGDMPEDTELRNGVTNRDVLAWLEKQGEQILDNPVITCKDEQKLLRWCDEDKKMVQKFIEGFRRYSNSFSEWNCIQSGYIIDWLYSLKHRMQEKKQ